MSRKLRTTNSALPPIARFMRQRSRRTTTILVVACCLIVVVSASAHLLHSIKPTPGHGKDIASISSVFACLSTARSVGYVVPRFKVLRRSRRESGRPALYTGGLLRVQIGRAPPRSMELPPHQS